MTYVSDALDDIRSQIAADDFALEEARRRRDCVLQAARAFNGCLRIFSSGSLAHSTVNAPVSDADCGIVLDRRTYRTFGPDSDEKDPPNDLVEDVRKFIGPKVRSHYPNASLRITKRAIKVLFAAPLPDGQDPTVDLIVALTRTEGESGLWIPNIEQQRWDPSHPEGHTELLRGPDEATAKVRRRAIRLVKAWNKQYSEPALSSFNLEALALTSVTKGVSIAQAVYDLFQLAADDIERRLTPDPTGVSPPIKLLKSKSITVARLRRAASLMQHAVTGDDSDAYAALTDLYCEYQILQPPASKESLADRLRTVSSRTGGATPMAIPELAGRFVKPVRSYGVRRAQLFVPPPQRRSWFADPARLNSFRRNVGAAYPGTVGGIEVDAMGSKVYAVVAELAVPYYEKRRVRIELPAWAPIQPRINADGPAQSRHRFPDGSLCIWWDEDPSERRWEFDDGLVALLDAIAIHLFKEAWWREHREWLGPEAPHLAA